MHMRKRICRIFSEEKSVQHHTNYLLAGRQQLPCRFFWAQEAIEDKSVPDINDFITYFKQHTLNQLNELDEDCKKKEILLILRTYIYVHIT